MALILNLETATKTCSVALAQNGKTLSCKEITSEKFSHVEKLNGFIEDVMKDADKSLSDLDAVAISEGPGSYTGLRIGTSTAKGICYALEIPLIAINSLKALATLEKYKDRPICPMFDARRMEVYTCVLDENLEFLESTHALVIDDISFENHKTNGLVFIGPGAAKCKEVLNHSAFIFNLNIKVSAKGMAVLSEAKYNSGDFVDVAYFEPHYLKDFIAGKPKKLL